MMKNYVLELLHLCSDQQFGQDAIEWAINTGLLKLTHNLECDLAVIVGSPNTPNGGKYCEILEAYRRAKHQ